MRRVYAIWFVRQVLSPLSIKIAIALTLVWQLKEYVSVRQVIANAPSLADPLSSLSFLSTAFVSTQLVVQILVVGLILSLAWFFRDILKGYAAFDRLRLT